MEPCRLRARVPLPQGTRASRTVHPYRTEFQRDRERIIHSRAFRRLEYKTQVFINHEGDHYRTRLTHTIEVAQISRTIARALRLNEDLAESIALAHDLGHTPFGHAGERELDQLLKEHGGFEHNRQSLRVVDVLEKNYSGFDGLNLTWETREGIVKHSSPYDHPGTELFAPQEQPSLEAQIIDLADEIAYNNHDLDDGISSGLIHIDEVTGLHIWHIARDRFGEKSPGDVKLMVRGIIRNIINLLVSDLLETTQIAARTMGVTSYDQVRSAGKKIVGISAHVAEANGELKAFLRSRLYQHYKVARMTMKAQKVVRELFTIYTGHPDTLPGDYQERIRHDGVIRTASDYIAGMTDRFALEEHNKLTDPMIRV
jgi:dGTPase